MDEFEIRRRMDRAAKARAVLSSDLVLELFQEMEQELTDAWKDSLVEREADRETLYHRVLALRHLRNRLNALVRDGEVAAEDLAREYPD